MNPRTRPRPALPRTRWPCDGRRFFDERRSRPLSLRNPDRLRARQGSGVSGRRRPGYPGGGRSRRDRPTSRSRLVSAEPRLGSVRPWCGPGRTPGGVAGVGTVGGNSEHSMNGPAAFWDPLLSAFATTPNSVIGLVDDAVRRRVARSRCVSTLKTAVAGSGRCRSRRGGSGLTATPEERVPGDVGPHRDPLQRAHVAGSVTPYRGDGEIAAGIDPTAVFRVSFANTPAEQWLEVRYRDDGNDEEGLAAAGFFPGCARVSGAGLGTHDSSRGRDSVARARFGTDGGPSHGPRRSSATESSPRC